MLWAIILSLSTIEAASRCWGENDAAKRAECCLFPRTSSCWDSSALNPESCCYPLSCANLRDVDLWASTALDGQTSLLTGNFQHVSYVLIDYVSACPSTVSKFLTVATSQFLSFILQQKERLCELRWSNWRSFYAWMVLKNAFLDQPPSETGNMFLGDERALASGEKAAERIDVMARESTLLIHVQGIRRHLRSAEIRRQLGVGNSVIDLKNFQDIRFSQSWGDGVLEGLFGALGLLDRPGFYVEIGTQTAEECSSRNFRLRYGWKGVAFDAAFANDYLPLRRQFMREETVNEIFIAHNVPYLLELLIIDIDGQDIYLWEQIKTPYRAKVVQIEYDRYLDFDEERVLPRDSSFSWDGINLTGSSIKPIVALGRKLGYSLVAVDWGNLIFVADEWLGDRQFYLMNDGPAMARHYHAGQGQVRNDSPDHLIVR